MAITIANQQSSQLIPMSQVNTTNGQMVSTPMVSIGNLLELAIKKTFRDLSLLAELLPRKTDMERKIEIMLFANRNRQLFVRLLALVKWAGSASKVEKCSQIVSFLDKQSMLFTETADILARLSRETLVSARLPAFQLLAAVEVLTLGTYSRLPNIIRDRLVPPDPISNAEKRAALFQLNHIIQQRLVASELPLQMRNIKIEFGRVTFTVSNEFSLTLTLLSDNNNMPWKVLNIEILIEDKEINDIKDLVQQEQLNFIRIIIQTRLNDNQRPLVEAYNILHTFCLGLQLQVLAFQSDSVYKRLKEFIHIDEYHSGKHLILSYWKDNQQQQDKSSSSSYKLIIKIDSTDPTKPLQIQHNPEFFDSTIFLKSIQANILSIEKILLFTTHERSKLKLIDLKKFIEEKNSLSLICELNELPAVLHISFIQPCMPSEQLLISIDMLTGQFLVHIPQYEDCPLIMDFESNLNKNFDRILTMFDKLKVWITRERCKKTVEALPVRIIESLPFPLNYSNDDLQNIHGNKLYFIFTRHQDKCLMINFDNDQNSNINIWMDYYLLHLNNISIQDQQQQQQQKSNQIDQFDQQECPKHFIEILKILPLDSSNILQNYYYGSSSNYNNDQELNIGRKRKSSTNTMINLQSIKRKKLPGYYITELAHIVSFCDEKLSYTCLSQELYKRNIYHQIVPDPNGCTHYIDIIKFPSCSWCPQELTEKILSNTLSCTIRLHGKSSRVWNVIISFATPPIQNLPVKEHCLRKIVNNSYDYTILSQSVIVRMVDELLNDWTAIARLYDVVEKFSQEIKHYSSIINLSSIEIKSFSYKKISIGYGPNKSFFVSIYYKFSEKRFQLSFGVLQQSYSNTNPHIIISTQLQHEFNQHLSIVQLIHVLNYTLNPLLTVQNLKSIPLLGTVNSRPRWPVLSFCVLPESSTHIKLIYRNTYCLDIVMYADNLVSIRDGALSNFDNSKVISDFKPIQGLKAFLSKFIDKTIQTRRLSQTEDDNPPSPIAQIDYPVSNDNYMFTGTQMKPNSNIQQQQQQQPPPINEPNLTNRSSVLPLHSSPHTPASPLASVLSVHSNYAPSPGNFSLSSPPSHPGLQQQQQPQQANPMAPSPQMPQMEQSPASVFNINSPMNTNLATPSPSSFLPTPSPGPVGNFLNTQSPAPSQFISQTNPGSHESGGGGIGSPFNQPNIPGSSLNNAAQQSIASPVPNLWPASPSISSRPSPRPAQTVSSTQSPVGTSLINTQQQQQQQQYQTQQIQSRTLPQKPWAAALPTMLTHQGLEMMCRSGNDNGSGVGQSASNIYYSYSQLERFLGSTFMRRHFSKPIEENFTIIQTMEPGTIMFKNDTLQFKIWMDFNTLSIHMYVKSISEMNQWNREELDIIQQYFETKIACAPFKPNSFNAFARFFNVPMRVLKDLIRIMRLELHPDPTLKWTAKISLTFPPFGSINSVSIGMSAFSQIQLTHKNPIQGQMMANNVAAVIQPFILFLPLIYETSINTLTLMNNLLYERSQNQNLIQFVQKILKRCNEYAQNNVECILYSAIREIMNTLQYPLTLQ
uniref:Mediator of RNA polymerase II transcription subunit 14 n=1 Tax=Dermatophagoides pteronyssinus TaxID=6956 RepID=A0A6P6XXN5_DERPT|nr:mediator of RNA polymerase II transcription subunit 14-like [Dermatophagoides pteronyssinus]